jgi:hypothetical protein
MPGDVSSPLCVTKCGLKSMDVLLIPTYSMSENTFLLKNRAFLHDDSIHINICLRVCTTLALIWLPCAVYLLLLDWRSKLRRIDISRYPTGFTRNLGQVLNRKKHQWRNDIGSEATNWCFVFLFLSGTHLSIFDSHLQQQFCSAAAWSHLQVHLQHLSHGGNIKYSRPNR